MTAQQTFRLRASWEMASLARPMIMLAPLNVAFASLVAIGLGLLIPDLTPEAARYLTSGAPTVILLTVGIVAIPQEIARRRDSGAHDFMATIPGPHVAHLAGMLTPHLILNVPSALLSVLVASWYFDFTLQPTIALLPALMLVSVTGVSIGNALAVASPNSVTTTTLSQVALFFIMLFSPINYPADRLPDWLASVHEILPFEPMASLVRQSLIGGPVSIGDSAHVLAWALGSFIVSARYASRPR